MLGDLQAGGGLGVTKTVVVTNTTPAPIAIFFQVFIASLSHSGPLVTADHHVQKPGRTPGWTHSGCAAGLLAGNRLPSGADRGYAFSPLLSDAGLWKKRLTDEMPQYLFTTGRNT